MGYDPDGIIGVPTNTRNEDPLLMLAEALFFGPDAAIRNQEARGQQELIESGVLPSEILWCTQADMEAHGFVFGDILESDPLFRKVQIPEGWHIEAGASSLWSKIMDARDIEMVSVFYKAAFYDRHAHMGLADVGGKFTEDYIYGVLDSFETLDLLTNEERSKALMSAQFYLHEGINYPDVYDKQDRAVKLLEGLKKRTEV